MLLCARRRLPAPGVLLLIASIAFAPSLAQAIGSSGWFATRIKAEYQYTDYNAYRYPPAIKPVYPDVNWDQPEPYFAEFPEHRSLLRITQSFGPQTSVQFRFQYSDLTDARDQRLYLMKYARELTGTLTISGAWQLTDQPGYMRGNALLVALRHDRSGWILIDGGLGLYRNDYQNGGVSPTIAPNLAVRWSLNGVTAVSGRWDGFFTRFQGANSSTHALTATLSRYFESQTALHLMARYFSAEGGLKSLSPALEVAQYIRWNLTFRGVYRYYENGLEENAAYETVRSHSIRGFLEWQIGSDLKLHFKLRRYWSGDDVQMNTYLLGFEYLI